MLGDKTGTKEHALEAARLLDRLLVDLVVGTRSLEIFNAINGKREIRPEVFHGMLRMCHSHILLGLFKTIEFYKTYHDLIPKSCRVPFKDLMKSVQAKKIDKFRNKYIGHIIDEKTGRPLNMQELEAYLSSIYGEDDSQFVSWVNDQKNLFPSTACSVLESTRDEIMKEHGIAKQEMSQWKDL